MQGFCVGVGLATNSLGVGTLFKLAYTLLRNKKITFLQLMRTLYVILNGIESLSAILRNMGDSNKAKLAYKSVFVYDRVIFYAKNSPDKQNGSHADSDPADQYGSPDDALYADAGFL